MIVDSILNVDITYILGKSYEGAKCSIALEFGESLRGEKKKKKEEEKNSERNKAIEEEKRIRYESLLMLFSRQK